MLNRRVAKTAAKAAPSESRAMVPRRSPRQHLESLVRADYERCHPEDSFDDLKRRARFTKEDKGLLRDWLVVAERRERVQFADTAMINAD